MEKRCYDLQRVDQDEGHKYLHTSIDAYEETLKTYNKDSSIVIARASTMLSFYINKQKTREKEVLSKLFGMNSIEEFKQFAKKAQMLMTTANTGSSEDDLYRRFLESIDNTKENIYSYRNKKKDPKKAIKQITTLSVNIDTVMKAFQAFMDSGGIGNFSVDNPEGQALMKVRKVEGSLSLGLEKAKAAGGVKALQEGAIKSLTGRFFYSLSSWPEIAAGKYLASLINNMNKGGIISDIRQVGGKNQKSDIEFDVLNLEIPVGISIKTTPGKYAAVAGVHMHSGGNFNSLYNELARKSDGVAGLKTDSEVKKMANFMSYAIVNAKKLTNGGTRIMKTKADGSFLINRKDSLSKSNFNIIHDKLVSPFFAGLSALYIGDEMTQNEYDKVDIMMIRDVIVTKGMILEGLKKSLNDTTMQNSIVQVRFSKAVGNVNYLNFDNKKRQYIKDNNIPSGMPSNEGFYALMRRNDAIKPAFDAIMNKTTFNLSFKIDFKHFLA